SVLHRFNQHDIGFLVTMRLYGPYSLRLEPGSPELCYDVGQPRRPVHHGHLASRFHKPRTSVRDISQSPMKLMTGGCNIGIHFMLPGVRRQIRWIYRDEVEYTVPWKGSQVGLLDVNPFLKVVQFYIPLRQIGKPRLNL